MFIFTLAHAERGVPQLPLRRPHELRPKIFPPRYSSLKGLEKKSSKHDTTRVLHAMRQGAAVGTCNFLCTMLPAHVKLCRCLGDSFLFVGKHRLQVLLPKTKLFVQHLAAVNRSKRNGAAAGDSRSVAISEMSRLHVPRSIIIPYLRMSLILPNSFQQSRPLSSALPGAQRLIVSIQTVLVVPVAPCLYSFTSSLHTSCGV